METVLSMKTVKGSEIMQHNSRFTAYAAPVKNIGDINKVYQKIKLVQPDARHVVCAYVINREKPCFSNDYQDDGEPGAGESHFGLSES